MKISKKPNKERKIGKKNWENLIKSLTIRENLRKNRENLGNSRVKLKDNLGKTTANWENL